MVFGHTNIVLRILEKLLEIKTLLGTSCNGSKIGMMLFLEERRKRSNSIPIKVKVIFLLFEQLT